MRRYIGTIGVTKFSANQKAWLRDAIGKVLPGDHGKQVFQVGGRWSDVHGWDAPDGGGRPVYQVESDGQRDARLAAEADSER